MNALNWNTLDAGEGTVLRASAAPSPMVSYEIHQTPDGFYVDRILTQGGGSFRWPIEIAANDMASAQAAAQTDWDGLHG